MLHVNTQQDRYEPYNITLRQLQEYPEALRLGDMTKQEAEVFDMSKPLINVKIHSSIDLV